MDMIDLQELVKHPETLKSDTWVELQKIMLRYPYFQVARMLYLKSLYMSGDPSFGKALHDSAVYITDRSFLYHLLESKSEKETQQVNEVQKLTSSSSNDRALTLIDAFLAKVPDEAMTNPLWEGDVSADYASVLLKKEEQGEVAPLRGQALIDRFIAQTETGEGFRTKSEKRIPDNDGCVSEGMSDNDSLSSEEEYLDDDSCFTETLAKIYIKQRRYSKALEIIKKLSLKYPEKNIYFADQIRFLEKLIINTKSK